MRVPALLAPTAVCLSLTIAACGGPGTGGAPAVTPSAPAVQPLAGVPVGTHPLPLPERGQAYDNPQPRDQVRDGGTLTLDVAELGP